MKKERIYSFTYALVLTVILLSTSLSAQYTSLESPANSYLALNESVENVVAVDNSAIKEISTHLKERLDFLKYKLDLILDRDVLVRVDVTEDGSIKRAQVTDGGNSDLNRLIVSVIEDIDHVTPISFDGLALNETIWIPVRFE